jgi:hypothetical protein
MSAALKDVGAEKYSHPAHPDRTASSRATLHEECFKSLQKEAKYIKASVDGNCEPNSSGKRLSQAS